jgi:hypothetical protein
VGQDAGPRGPAGRAGGPTEQPLEVLTLFGVESGEQWRIGEQARVERLPQSGALLGEDQLTHAPVVGVGLPPQQSRGAPAGRPAR